jgi:molybdopterin synthase catalytic subunit
MKIYCRLVDGAASADWCRGQLAGDPAVGCLLAFSGQVRSSNNERDDVVALCYEAYPEMFESEISKIADEMKQLYQLHALAIEHSVGEVKLGQDAVHVVVSAVHRRDTFAALDYFMAQLKKRVPIFKKELYSDGTQWLGEQQ